MQQALAGAQWWLKRQLFKSGSGGGPYAHEHRFGGEEGAVVVGEAEVE